MFKRKFKEMSLSQYFEKTVYSSSYAKKKNTLVSGNAGETENLYGGSQKLIFLINLFKFFK